MPQPLPTSTEAFENPIDWRARWWRWALDKYFHPTEVPRVSFAELIFTRTPDLEALREKVRLLRENTGVVALDDTFTQLLADIDQLL